jgi:hypothetical protein
MPSSTLRLVIAGALFVHGIGHSLGFFMPARSWLLPGLSEGAQQAIAGVFWSLSVAGFLAATLAYLGILLPVTWWPALAIGFACVSLVGLAVFIGTWPVVNTIGAVGMNLAILVTQVWPAWPPADVAAG